MNAFMGSNLNEANVQALRGIILQSRYLGGFDDMTLLIP